MQTTASTNAPEKLKELKTRADRLNTAVIRLNADIDNAQETLDKLLAQAQEEFGTQDVAELEKKLAQMDAENQQILQKAEKEIDILTTSTREKQEAIQKIKAGM